LVEQSKLQEALKNNESACNTRIAQLQQEFSNTMKSHEYQAKSIENLMTQKKNLMNQLSTEIKRNGLLVKTNSELKQSLHLQQLVLQNLALDEKTTEALTQKTMNNQIQSIKIPPPTFSTHPRNTDSESETAKPPNPDPGTVSPLAKKNGVIVKKEPYVQLSDGGWLASLPLIGRLWGSTKVLKRTFEVTV